MDFDVRRVVTGHDDSGRAVFLSDGAPRRTIGTANGFGVSDLLWLDGPAITADDGGEAPDGAVVIEPPPGGLSIRMIRIPPPAPGTPPDEQWLRVDGDDPARPGMHTTDTLDFVMILDGEIVLGLDDGEHALAPGDVVIQCGTSHRWRVTGDRPCTYAVFMFRTNPSAAPPALPIELSDADSGLGPRRLVAATDADGRSYVAARGCAPSAFQPAGPDGVTLVELWQTGGPVRRADQGGDPTGPWEFEPRGGGIAFRYVEMPAGSDPGDAGWHTTATIDLNLMLSGHLELALPDTDPVVIGPHESAVQRATNHRWRPIGDQPTRHVAIMVAVNP